MIVGKTERMRRRVLTAAIAVSSLLVTVLVAAAATRPSPSAEDELRQRLRRNGAETQTAFTFVGGGTRVLECFFPNRRYGGVTDPAGRRAVFWLGDDPKAKRIIAFVDEDAVVLHRSLFDDAPFGTEWVAFATPLSPNDLTTLSDIAGQDLAADLSATAPPPLAATVVETALNSASSVKPIGSASIAGRQVDGFRIEVDPNNLAGSAPAGLSQTGADLVPMLEVWITPDGAVARIVVRPQRPDRTVAAPEEGWSIDYRPADIDIGALRPTNLTDAEAIPRTEMRPAAFKCAVPI